MNNLKPITWHNPLDKIWGFHIHQELPLEDFDKALVIQKNCTEFLEKNKILVDVNAAFKPGYGPHLNYMWELRVESETENLFEKLGLAISYMCINRFGLSAFIHPLMHDRSLPEDLVTEGQENQTNTLWFSHQVTQNQDFFLILHEILIIK